MDRKQPGKRMLARMKRLRNRLPKHIAEMEEPSDEELATLQEEANADDIPGYLSMLEFEFDDGNPSALTDAIATCAEAGIPIAPWAAKAFIHAHHQVRSHKVRSWDKVLGNPVPKGRHLKAVRSDKILRDQVRRRCDELLASEDLAIDDLLFERVGQEFGIGITKTKSLYYPPKRLLRN